MTLTPDGASALRAMLDTPAMFPRLKQPDWTAAAIKLAKKQIIAAGQTTEALIDLQTAIGEDIFQRTLDTLTAHQAKQLAKRIDPDVNQETIASCNMSLRHIRTILNGETPTYIASAETSATPDETAKPKNKYLGRKAFRTGR